MKPQERDLFQKERDEEALAKLQSQLPPCLQAWDVGQGNRFRAAGLHLHLDAIWTAIGDNDGWFKLVVNNSIVWVSKDSEKRTFDIGFPDDFKEAISAEAFAIIKQTFEKR